MIPYRGRLALRIARIALAFGCASWYVYTTGFHLNWVLALLAAYAVYSIAALSGVNAEPAWGSALASVADMANFGLWTAIAPGSGPPALACGYLLASAAITQDLLRYSATAVVALLVALLLTPGGDNSSIWTILSAAAVGTALGYFRRYLDRRMSMTLRHNVVIRSQAETAREVERQRIAADFHDGPLQSFISFQMRLEVIRKLLARDVEAAAQELSLLQDLCRSQVADLRGFVRSMRPADEGMSLGASLSRMAELFQRDSGIAATFTAGDFPDPAETEVALELLQIAREALNNVQKHSGATRVAIHADRRRSEMEITIEDNGGGFPFAGAFSLEELELLRLGPVSIKSRVRMLGGDITIRSKPGVGARLEIRVPV